jgi:Glycosyltransferase family 87
VIAPRRFTELAAVAAAALFLLSWLALHTAWYDEREIVDTPVYDSYGTAIENGAVPYRDIRPEYPPGALPAFVVPALLSDDEQEFRDVFEWLMALFGVVTVLLTAVSLRGLGASRARTAGALALVAAFPLLLGSVVLTRFDLYPVVFVAAALAALVHRRDRLGFALLGAAVAVKLYPAVLVPVALGYVWNRRGRREALVCLAFCAGVVALAFLPFLLIAPDGVAHSLGRQLSRPLQIESLGAALYLGAHHLVGLDVEMRSGHGSQNLYGSGTAFTAAVLSLLQLAVLVWIWLRRPAEKEELVRWSAAALVAFVALGKVLSPQFLIWLAPVVPLVGGLRGLRASVLLAAALVLTQLWFPSRYWDLARELDALPSTLVLLRDLVLVAVLVTLVRDTRGESPRSR